MDRLLFVVESQWLSLWEYWERWRYGQVGREGEVIMGIIKGKREEVGKGCGSDNKSLVTTTEL